jgi:predicted nuclease of predicted toxin-antitoxin system
VKLLLDEMWLPEAARQLRHRGHDVLAVAERSDLRSRSDSVIFGTAQAEDRTLVTENVPDFRALATMAIQQGQSHFGLILTNSRRFPRQEPRTLGRLVAALDRLLIASEDLQNREYWLQQREGDAQ